MPNTPSPMDIPENTQPMQIKKSRGRRTMLWIVCILVAATALFAGVCGWYKWQLRPLHHTGGEPIRIEILAGSTPADIAKELYENEVIRSKRVFSIYTKRHGVRDQLQAGVYNFEPDASTPEVVRQLVEGDTGALVVTFIPGATLYDSSDKPEEEKQDIYTSLFKVGYSDEAINEALEDEYDFPDLFQGKPAKATLEGYIYGDTYHFDENTPAKTVIERSLMELDTVVKREGLQEAFKKQGLTLYEGITLASIVEREVSNEDDQRQVAQVFLTRKKENMPLGSDVTAYYGAALEGKKQAVRTDTPYNTRMHRGLPPGPIASPGLSALQAVANPAKGSYQYFVSGDDDKTYFAHSQKQHESNVKNHCHEKCAVD